MTIFKGQVEKEALAKYQSIVGLDEVGRGCLAGPVFASAVALDYEKLWNLDPKILHLIRDSKTLSSQQRQKMIPIIKEIAVDYSISSCSVLDIENKGIVGATFTAMHHALKKLKNSYDLLLIDGRQSLPNYDRQQMCLIKGDSLCFAIAAASILAKEARDDFMRQADGQFPEYGFASHVGYGTKQHLSALSEHGICPLHRRNFAPIRNYVADCNTSARR